MVQRREPVDPDVASVAALAEPIRRDLFEYVVGAGGPVSRDQAAEGVGVPAHTAKFHLDRLVDEGLLESDFKRLTGRTGPGSGRPAKVYRRSGKEVSVSLPGRHYDLLSRILARAVAEAAASGADVSEAVSRVAREEGEAWGATAGPLDEADEIERLAVALSRGGYEPWVEDGTLLLRNCPFHRVAQQQTELVCGLNLDFVQGVASASRCEGVVPRLDPHEGRCCVSVARVDGRASVDAGAIVET